MSEVAELGEDGNEFIPFSEAVRRIGESVLQRPVSAEEASELVARLDTSGQAALTDEGITELRAIREQFEGEVVDNKEEK